MLSFLQFIEQSRIDSARNHGENVQLHHVHNGKRGHVVENDVFPPINHELHVVDLIHRGRDEWRQIVVPAEKRAKTAEAERKQVIRQVRGHCVVIEKIGRVFSLLPIQIKLFSVTSIRIGIGIGNGIGIGIGIGIGSLRNEFFELMTNHLDHAFHQHFARLIHIGFRFLQLFQLFSGAVQFIGGRIYKIMAEGNVFDRSVGTRNIHGEVVLQAGIQNGECIHTSGMANHELHRGLRALFDSISSGEESDWTQRGGADYFGTHGTLGVLRVLLPEIVQNATQAKDVTATRGTRH